MLAQKIIDTISGYIPFEDFDGSTGIDTTNSNSSNDDSTDSAAIAKTINAVHVFCNPQVQKRLKLDVSSFILILQSESESESESGSGRDDESGLRLVKEIVEAARTAAPSHACSSVLAGHASESDEYADVGLFLGAGTVDIKSADESVEKKARAVLSSLGLDSLQSSQKITPLPLSPETNTPLAFRASGQDADVQHLSTLLARLSHRFAFCVAVESVVFHFLLGQVSEGGSWAGLLGVGIWSD